MPLPLPSACSMDEFKYHIIDYNISQFTEKWKILVWDSFCLNAPENTSLGNAGCMRIRAKRLPRNSNKQWRQGGQKYSKYMGYWPSFFGQDGWILAKFFFAWSINSQKEEANIGPCWPKTLDQYEIYYLALGEFFSRGTRRLVPSVEDSSILPARVANHNARFGSSCLLTEQAIK